MYIEIRLIARLVAMLTICIVAMFAGQTVLMWFAFAAAALCAMEG